MARYVLKLYVAGDNRRSRRAIRHLREICAELEDDYALEIVDVLQEPERAEDERILVTPQLVRRLPPPLRRIIGDLSDHEQVIRGLELISDAPDGAEAPPHAADRSAAQPS